jgi:PEP-CTERM motif
MKIVIPALAAAFIATVGASSGAQAAVIDFSAAALCPASCTGITYAGTNLGISTAFDLDGSTWLVTRVNTGDMSGLAAGGTFTVVPSSVSYGLGGGPVTGLDITKMWTATTGPFTGTTFTETLTSITSISRGVNTIGLDFAGTITGGVFHDTAATMDLTLNQAGGPGNVVSASLTNSASTVPEPATWVMLALGFAGLGYAAVRRSAKDKVALAI